MGNGVNTSLPSGLPNLAVAAPPPAHAPRRGKEDILGGDGRPGHQLPQTPLQNAVTGVRT